MGSGQGQGCLPVLLTPMHRPRLLLTTRNGSAALGCTAQHSCSGTKHARQRAEAGGVRRPATQGRAAACAGSGGSRRNRSRPEEPPPRPLARTLHSMRPVAGLSPCGVWQMLHHGSRVSLAHCGRAAGQSAADEPMRMPARGRQGRATRLPPAAHGSSPKRAHTHAVAAAAGIRRDAAGGEVAPLAALLAAGIATPAQRGWGRRQQLVDGGALGLGRRARMHARICSPACSPAALTHLQPTSWLYWLHAVAAAGWKLGLRRARG